MKNYHTHTERCHHAVGNVSEYAEYAVNKKMTHLGFSDHTPLPDNRWSDVRMHISELEDYVREIDEVRQKYQNIKIYKGAECEYAPEYVSFYKEELKGKYKFDYLIGGAHYFPRNGEWINCYGAENSKKNLSAYTDYLIETIDCDLFVFIAHPDLFARFYHSWDVEAIACSKAILQAASDKNAILEINGYGYRKSQIITSEGKRRPYPVDPFWEMAAEYKIPVSINSDAHKPEDIDNFGDAHNLVEKLKLTARNLNFE